MLPHIVFCSCIFVFLCRNKAIADYLASNGYAATLAEFQKEADMVSSSALLIRADNQMFPCWSERLI